MNGSTGFNVRYQKGLGHSEIVLRVSPSTAHNARQVADALRKDGMGRVEIWRSGQLFQTVVFAWGFAVSEY